MSWLLDNLPSVIVGVILLVIVASIVRGQVRKRKNGGSSCGCGCSGCAMSEHCHPKQK